MRVLVIDDDDIARELLVSTLVEGGHEVFGLPSAIGATRVIFEKSIDAVVIDVMMPDINGDKLARLLRQNSRGAQLAIVLVSSRPSDELEELARAANADAVMPKTQIRAGLRAAVSSALQRRASSSDPRNG